MKDCESVNPFDNMNESELYKYAYAHCRCGLCQACKDRAQDARECCQHESEATPDGNGSYCRICGETLS